jgi:FMN phosphatase YigB (HAD superfamily)
MRHVVLFDFGGTLDADGDRWAVRFHRAYTAVGGQLVLEDFERLFRESDRRLEAEPAVRSMGFRDMIDAQAALLRELLPDGQSLDLARAAAQFHGEALGIVRRNRPMLERLSGRYRLGIVSNFTGNLAHCIAELGLLDIFGEITDSALVGWAKPDHHIFLCALENLSARPDDAWMVGDNVEADLRPAATLGLCTCWLAPAERPMPPGLTVTGRIARLPDLAPLLNSCTD